MSMSRSAPSPAANCAALLASALCIAHCAAEPLAVSAALLAFANPQDHPALHLAWVGASLPLSGYGLWRNWRSVQPHYGRWLGALGWVLLAGGALTSAGQWSEASERTLIVSGGLLLVAFHVRCARGHYRSAPEASPGWKATQSWSLLRTKRSPSRWRATR